MTVAAAHHWISSGLAQSGAALLRLDWLWPGLVVAALSSALPYALEMYALQHLPKRSFSILLSLEPAVGAVAGWIILSEALNGRQWLAIALVMGLVFWRKRYLARTGE